MFVLTIVQFYKIFQLVLLIFACSYFLGILWHIYAKDLSGWETHATVDVYKGLDTFYTLDDYKLQQEESGLSNFGSLVIVWYYGLTTLSTIGYGDFSPVSTKEKVIVAVILMFAVAIFSIIMGNFIEILMSRNNLENSGNHKDLSKWIALLTKFNDQKPLARDLIVKIEDFFEYYWDNNPLMASKSDEDLRFINELPNATK